MSSFSFSPANQTLVMRWHIFDGDRKKGTAGTNCCTCKRLGQQQRLQEWSQLIDRTTKLKECLEWSSVFLSNMFDHLLKSVKRSTLFGRFSCAEVRKTTIISKWAPVLRGQFSASVSTAAAIETLATAPRHQMTSLPLSFFLFYFQ